MLDRQYTNQDILNVLETAGPNIRSPVTAYFIGGCAMTFRNLKPSTKDVDVLFSDDVSEKSMFEALMQIGFEELFPGAHELELNAKDILVNSDGLQFDLFTKIVMGGLRLTPAMQRRASTLGSYGELAVCLASKEDFYLFKAITDRPFPRDFEDLITLQQSSLDWKSVLSEYAAQIQGRPLEQNLRRKLTELKKAGYDNPLIRHVLR